MPHERASWDLGQASSDVIEGRDLKLKRRLSGFRPLRKYIRARHNARHIASHDRECAGPFG